MSIRSVACPGCGAAANVPAAMANTRCPACGLVWNIHQPVAAKPDSPPQPTDEARQMDASAAVAMVGIVGGGMLLMLLIGTAIFLLRPSGTTPAAGTTAAGTPAAAATEIEEDTIKPRVPEPYREIRKPEQTRQQIYKDYRQVARTTIEKPLPLLQGSPPRRMMEDMLQKTFDRELSRFAALHNVDVDDIHEVIKEGDANNWDPSPRSNAVRGGKRVYPKEKSEGWQPNPNRK